VVELRRTVSPLRTPDTWFGEAETIGSMILNILSKA
jgi:hypothetical protein